MTTEPKKIRCQNCKRTAYEIQGPVTGVILKICEDNKCKHHNTFRFTVIHGIQFCNGERV